ncbi:hypothetical protein HN011_000897 [Eciton burchellii]|nr:hypothetical protein HN011_000897 [Eciton burchellii]
MQFEKDISYSHIKTELDNIAEQVKTRLKIENPMHPIFSATPEQFSYWKYNNISEDKWNNKDGKQILGILCKVVSEELKFSANRCCATISSIDLHYINLPSDDIQISGNVVTLIDVLSLSDIYDPTMGYDMYDKIMLQLINCLHVRHIRNEIIGCRQTRWLLEFQHMMQPENMASIKKLYEYYNHHGIKTSSLTPILKKIIHNPKHMHTRSACLLLKKIEYEEEILKFEEKDQGMCEPKRKKADVKFTVGMIVSVICEERLAGVIIGWNDKRTNVNRFFKCLNNPFKLFYTVLCDDNRLHFVPKDLIEKIDYPRAISNNHIGKFFSEFKGTYYVPNEMLAYEYPDDVLYLSKKL